MDPLILELFRYGDASDAHLLAAAAKLAEPQLDQGFDIGRGSLRRTLMHIWAGHDVWLSRWQGNVETPWPDEDEPVPLEALAQRFEATARSRRPFLAELKAADLARDVTYRDSKGSLFHATLGQMIVQGVVHAVHHRAQAANILRRLDAGLVELDYMTSVRRAAG